MDCSSQTGKGGLFRPESFWLVAPYAAWMALMALLPATAGAYAVRTAVAAVVLAAACVRLRLRVPIRPLAHSIIRLFDYSIIGLLVFLVWVLPEQFGWEWYREWCIVGDGGTRAIAEAGAAMVAVRLAGSAFVISVAEEMFFRRWLVGFAGPWWSVALFAVEHDRWLVGAVAGAAYWLLCRRRGLLAAAVAHATTNLALGVWVLRTGQWQFW